MIERQKDSGVYVRMICFMGIMTALQFVTEYLLSFTIAEKYRISVTFLIRAITGYCIGWRGRLHREGRSKRRDHTDFGDGNAAVVIVRKYIRLR